MRTGWGKRQSKAANRRKIVGYALRILRQQVLSRQPYCSNSNITHGRRVATQVDHIRPLAEGGSDSPDNMQSLCTPCHKEKTQQESCRAKGHGAPTMRAYFTKAGDPKDKSHSWYK